MSAPAKENSYFSSLCIERCGGACCDPWWGIISYKVIKKGGLSNLKRFEDEVAEGVDSRARRIAEAYVTDEDPPRPLFGPPERYTVKLRGVRVSGTALELDLLAMFAFRCRFLSEEKTCAIHPSFLGGKDIRPPHCGYMGALEARPGEKGFCRVIHAAVSGNEEAVAAAIEAENDAGQRFLREGFSTAREAARDVVASLHEHCAKNLSHLLPREREDSSPKAGRNDPCPCGSGRKYKKCHGSS